MSQIAGWAKQRDELLKGGAKLTHKRSHEYGSRIIEAMTTDVPFEIGGNILNRGLIPNLPAEACVEVPCLVNRNGVQGCYVGPLPAQLAALNLSHIVVHELTIEAAATRRKDAIYHAAMMDPHTRAELTLDQIRAMCDELIAAHGAWLPKFR